MMRPACSSYSAVTQIFTKQLAQSASVEVASLCNVSRVTVEPQVGISGHHAKRLELRCNQQSASSNVDGGDIGR